ncbi:MAG: HPr-rel-A system PqqD family peptide chaperone [Candidatus Competibacteraceae bacterium]|nr:HPr-rel-A system PqqD family peptide chaperone [Candidatus Competibacteraceae bacterium]
MAGKNAATLLWRQFDEGRFIVFNKASGETHIVNELCVDALELLQQLPLDSQMLAESLARRNEFSLDEDWLIYINEMLADMDRLGLVEPVAS